MHARHYNPRMHKNEEGGVKQTHAKQDSDQGQTTKACSHIDTHTLIHIWTHTSAHTSTWMYVRIFTGNDHVNVRAYMYANIYMYAHRHA